jgi:multidrug resistance efflux pump
MHRIKEAFEKALDEWRAAEKLVEERMQAMLQANAILSDAQRRVELLEAYHINTWATLGKDGGAPKNDAERTAKLAELCSAEHEELRIAKLGYQDAKANLELAQRMANLNKTAYESMVVMADLGLV